MITFNEIQVGKLYYIDSFDYGLNDLYHFKEVIFVLSKHMEDHEPCVRYLTGSEEYTIYFAYTKFFDITLFGQ